MKRLFYQTITLLFLSALIFFGYFLNQVFFEEHKILKYLIFLLMAGLVALGLLFLVNGRLMVLFRGKPVSGRFYRDSTIAEFFEKHIDNKNMSEAEISTKLHELANAEALSAEDKKNANTARALLQLYAKLNASKPE